MIVLLTGRAKFEPRDPHEAGIRKSSPGATLVQEPARQSLGVPAEVIGAAAQRTRVITSHDPARGLAEADMVLGLRAGRPALLRAAGDVSVAEIAQLYR